MKNSFLIFCRYFFLFVFALFIACSSGGSSSKKETSDFAGAAGRDGYTVPNVSVQGVDELIITDDTYTDIVDVGTTSTGQTNSGIVSVAGYISSTVSGTISVYVWVNDSLFIIMDNASPGASYVSSIVLSSGVNYICVVVYVNGVAWGRSEVVRIQSGTMASLARFELTWNGEGDVDLHLDNIGAGIHVYYGDPNYLSSGYDIALDVDNTDAYGPENIRVYDIPSSTTFRCFINYFYGSSSLTATVKVYTGDNLLVDTQTISLVPGDAQLSDEYDSYSKLVGSYSVSK